MEQYQSYLMRRWWLGLFLVVSVVVLVNCQKSDGGGGGGGGGGNASTPNTCGTGYLYTNQQLGCLTTSGCNNTGDTVYYRNQCVRVADINNPNSQYYYGGSQYNGQYGGQYGGYQTQPYYGSYTYGNPFYGSYNTYPYNYGSYGGYGGYGGGFQFGASGSARLGY